MAERGWDGVDVVFVTGDAYVDHPSFAMAILHRVLERAGFRVAILSQPDWKTCEPWRQFGRPRLFFAVSAGVITRQRLAPSAERKATSFCRASERVNNKLATFAHAMSSTKPTAANNTNKIGRTVPITSS